MHIKLEEADLKTAVQDFLTKMGINREIGDIQFKIGRNPQTVGVELEMRNPGVTAEAKGAIKASLEVVETTVSKVAKEPVAEPVAEEEEPTTGDETEETGAKESLFS